MRLKDILDKTNWNGILEAGLVLYGKESNFNNYKVTYDEMCSWKDNDLTDVVKETYKIKIEKITLDDDEENDEDIDISLLENDDSSIKTAMTGIPRRATLGFEVLPYNKNLTDCQIIAAYIWENSFFGGLTEAEQLREEEEVFKELKERLAEIEAGESELLEVDTSRFCAKKC